MLAVTISWTRLAIVGLEEATNIPQKVVEVG